MSKALKCDRCGKLYELDEDKRLIFDGRYLSTLIAGSSNGHSFHSPFDICEQCADEFVTWWEMSDAKRNEVEK